ncbi:GNAT family N-acetyltransferase [Paenibacillus sp. MMS20-IR301]|uniref:GNAT family N-acetyltransferase n=1 Tax=Paenibacillus sp. MMS20-IR301 TaxID=2895946 RepID=UPI0028F0C7C3|nr:GNAT family N-acetyltransferase [Paenibacillus sp. MMS20-IR301]WNS43851.1 GNAT family N-acetyltransferase [Paenibacillus sp. MMS20-IR301]
MDIEFITIDQWDDALWRQMEPVYREAFPSGAKPEGILHSMLNRRIAYMHAGLNPQGQVIAMAVTGVVGQAEDKILIIDYLAVAKAQRGAGTGTWFLEQIRAWAVQEHEVRGIIIEAESGTSDTHKERIHFWERSGFVLTSYVHQYIWVPEPYQALLLPLDGPGNVADDGEALFRYINAFHSKAYRKG